MIQKALKRSRLIEAVCLFGEDARPGDRYEKVLLDRGGDCGADVFENILCHTVTADGRLLVSDFRQSFFFFISDGWGSIGNVLCGLTGSGFCGFDTDRIGPDDILAEIESLQAGHQKTGLYAAMSRQDRLDRLKTLFGAFGQMYFAKGD